MQNEYASPEIIEIGQAQFVVQGVKDFGTPDVLTGDRSAGYLIRQQI